MLKLEFVGNKPIITPSGVSFDTRKIDKYEFIEPAAHILQMFLNISETHNIEKLEPSEVYGEDKIFSILKEARPTYEQFFLEHIAQYKLAIEKEIEEVSQHDYLNKSEKETLVKNYEFMREYRVQRATNKIIYEEIINACVEFIEKKKIAEVKAPFSNTFLHVLGSLKSTMDLQKRAPRSDVEVKLDKENPYAQLSITF